ncbi:MAG: putative amidohydrolase [Parasphingorhabdus sp.]
MQMCSTGLVGENLAAVDVLVKDAVADGAKAVVLPENFALMPMQKQDLLECANNHESAINGHLSNLAANLGIVIVAGSFPAPSQFPYRILASCRVYEQDGRMLARYDKSHLFDVVISEDESYLESEYTAYGDSVVAVDTSVGKLGLTICYDMRFPELFRALKQQGVDVYTVPSAFTVPTGKAHWDVLLRARAIENIAYLVAPAQVGQHPSGRLTYGHSMIVSPWGEVLALKQEGVGYCIADLNLQSMLQQRKKFPALDHQRIFINESMRDF